MLDLWYYSSIETLLMDAKSMTLETSNLGAGHERWTPGAVSLPDENIRVKGRSSRSPKSTHRPHEEGRRRVRVALVSRETMLDNPSKPEP